jgi:hypothetical protein
MLRWKIFKSASEFVYIYADSFDAALKIARKIDPNFCAGYVDEE